MSSSWAAPLTLPSKMPTISVSNPEIIQYVFSRWICCCFLVIELDSIDLEMSLFILSYWLSDDNVGASTMGFLNDWLSEVNVIYLLMQNSGISYLCLLPETIVKVPPTLLL